MKEDIPKQIVGDLQRKSIKKAIKNPSKQFSTEVEIDTIEEGCFVGVETNGGNKILVYIYLVDPHASDEFNLKTFSSKTNSNEKLSKKSKKLEKLSEELKNVLRSEINFTGDFKKVTEEEQFYDASKQGNGTYYVLKLNF